MTNLFELASEIANGVRTRFFSTKATYRRGDRVAEIDLAFEPPGSNATLVAGVAFFENAVLFSASVDAFLHDGTFVPPKRGDVVETTTATGRRVFVVAEGDGAPCWVWRPDDPAQRSILIRARERRAYFDPEKLDK